VARISFIGDDGEELEITVGPDNPDLFVGRHKTCAIRTANASVSRQHARVFFDGEFYWLQDNGSSNGTFYQSARLEPQVPVQIESGEYLLCGNFEMRFDYDDDDLARESGSDVSYGQDDAEPYEPAEVTRFADSKEVFLPPPPPPPPGFPPPPPPQFAPPPPPDAYVHEPEPALPAATELSGQRFDPVAAQASLDAEKSAALTAELAQLQAEVDGLYAELTQRDREVQALRIELESLSARSAGPDPASAAAAETARTALADAAAKLLAAESEIADHLDALAEAQDQIAACKAQIAGQESQLAQATAQVAALERQVGELQAQLTAATTQLAAASSQIHAAAEPSAAGNADDEAHIAALSQELAVVRELLKQAEDKFDEARAGRRNAEELASLLRSRAEAAEQRANASAAAPVAIAAAVPAVDSGLTAALEAAQNGQAEAQAAVTSLTAQAAALAEQVRTLTGDVAALTHQLSNKEAELADLTEQLQEQAAARAEAESLLAAQAGTFGKERAEADAASLAMADELAALRAELTAAQDRITTIQPAPAPVADAENERLRAEVAQLQAANRDLEASTSANLKRIQRLMRDVEEARAAASSPAAAAPAASAPALDPQVLRLVTDLNGVASSFRSDFMSMNDAYEMMRSEDEAEREDAWAQLQDGIESCVSRSAELKNLVLALRQAVGEVN
jgi:chromosome segregation ATPase